MEGKSVANCRLSDKVGAMGLRHGAGQTAPRLRMTDQLEFCGENTERRRRQTSLNGNGGEGEAAG